MPPKDIVLGGKKIIIVHDIKMLPKNHDAEIVVYGHLHKQKIEKIGNTLYINPGEACGWLTGAGTAAILDTEAMEVAGYELC